MNTVSTSDLNKVCPFFLTSPEKNPALDHRARIRQILHSETGKSGLTNLAEQKPVPQDTEELVCQGAVSFRQGTLGGGCYLNPCLRKKPHQL